MNYEELLNDWVRNMDECARKETCIQFGLIEDDAMKTNGGYIIEDFEVLENPIEMQFPENNHLYHGFAKIPMVDDKLERVELTWDKLGRVSNPSRWKDCNIDVSGFN